ncbi:MAG TPA: GNAT family N-acetyltransferase, partial [Tepiditoga sp.]|nr:GNAT family N-acetyltransferase [Tepiditoga sp.]
KFRGNGISGNLLDKAMEYAKSKGADIITALVRENNSASNSSFEKNNFEKSTDFFSIYSKKL